MVDVLSYLSWAVAVKLVGTPSVAVAAALTTKCVATSEMLVMLNEAGALTPSTAAVTL